MSEHIIQAEEVKSEEIVQTRVFFRLWGRKRLWPQPKKLKSSVPISKLIFNNYSSSPNGL